MRCAKIMIAPVLCVLAATPADFSGKQALEYTGRIVAFGPRPPGSAAIRKTQQHIVGELKRLGVETIQDDFQAQTPNGTIAMKNIIARLQGSTGRAVVISGHYDTKLMPGVHFVGANDGGASAGFLLEMARALKGRPLKDDIYLVWFDGEEAIAEWTEKDSLYGSRHLAGRWAAEGMLPRIKALINVDMIGDRNLRIVREFHSTPWLRELIWNTAEQLGYGRYFTPLGGAIQDDHVPFLRMSVPAIDLIHDYGGEGSYWHTQQDTMDKLGANAFQAVGDVLIQAIRKLEGRR
jgi:Zn-dependent M28 family amino/carboxypeptidase